MMRGTVGLLLAMGVLGGYGVGSAQERLPFPKESTPLPAQPSPAPVRAPIPLQVAPHPGGFYPLAFYRTSAYEHWQYLSPDRYGRFRPRVLNTPEGNFYYSNGQPYPWGPVEPRHMGTPGTVPR